MGMAKELLLTNKDLRLKWATVTHSDWFPQILILVRSECLDAGVGGPALEGAQCYERILTSICESDAETIPFPTSGLKHDIDNPRKEREEARSTLSREYAGEALTPKPQ